MATSSAERNKRFRLKHPWYVLYWAAKNRCENPKHKSYCRYGALGIKFLMTMHQVESLFNWDGGHWMKIPSLDRIDASKHYTLDNCRVIEKSVNELYGRKPAPAEWTD